MQIMNETKNILKDTPMLSSWDKKSVNPNPCMLTTNRHYKQQMVAEKESQRSIQDHTCTWYIFWHNNIAREMDPILPFKRPRRPVHAHFEPVPSRICTILSFVVVLLSSRVNNMSYSLASFCSLTDASAVRPTLIGRPSLSSTCV